MTHVFQPADQIIIAGLKHYIIPYITQDVVALDHPGISQVIDWFDTTCIEEDLASLCSSTGHKKKCLGGT